MKIIPISILVPYFISDSHLILKMQRRNSSDELNGLLEFPGGKIEDAETPSIACLREIFEETGVKLSEEQIRLFKTYSYDYPDKKVLLNVFIHRDSMGKFQSLEDIVIEDSFESKLEIPAANFRIIKDLKLNLT